MKQKFDSTVAELKFHLTLQLEAYQRDNLKLYDELELKILELEKKL